MSGSAQNRDLVPFDFGIRQFNGLQCQQRHRLKADVVAYVPN